MHHRYLGFLASLTVVCSAVTSLVADIDPKDAIWIEGERPSRSSVTRHPWWYDKVKQDVLSGGEWLSNYSKEKEGLAEYDFEVVTADTYIFWIRANPSVKAALSWHLDSGEWMTIDFANVRGQQNVAADNKPDMRFLAWVKAGAIALKPGKHTIKFKFGGSPENQHHGAIDCLVFTRVPFVPAGTQKPGSTKTGGAPDEWFPLVADDDTFSPESVIDMSQLIPAPAGEFGFVKAAGKDLRFEKSTKPAKFWGTGANVETGRYSRQQLTRRAKYFRKFGSGIL